MAHGGKREGAGRKPGSVSKLDKAARIKATEGGIMPLDYLLAIMRDETQEPSVRRDAAKAASPYCHARLASTEVSGPNGGAIKVAERTTRILDVSGLTLQQLEALKPALEATVARMEAEVETE